MPDLPMPPHLRDLDDVGVADLAAQYVDHLNALVAALAGAGRPGRPDAGELALFALLCGAALVERVLAARWPTVRDALAGGQALGDVAAALDVEPRDVVLGLRLWTIHQHRGGLMPDDERARVLALIERAGQ